MVKSIIPYIPKHKVYVEPFCGGAALLFEKPDYKGKSADSYIEVINDTSKVVHNFFVQLRDNGEELCRMLEFSLYSQEEYSISTKYAGSDPLLMAYYFFINTSQSFCKIMNRGWGTGINGINLAAVYLNRVSRLQGFIQRMRGMFISCEDSIRCIERWDSPDTFFYCDPPYPGTGMGHYKGYSQEDFQRLLDKLESIQGSFILSCYPNDAVNPDWKRVDFIKTGSCGNGKDLEVRNKITECLWMREATGMPRAEIHRFPVNRCKQKVCDDDKYYSLIA